MAQAIHTMTPEQEAAWANNPVSFLSKGGEKAAAAAASHTCPRCDGRRGTTNPDSVCWECWQKERDARPKRVSLCACGAEKRARSVRCISCHAAYMRDRRKAKSAQRQEQRSRRAAGSASPVKTTTNMIKDQVVGEDGALYNRTVGTGTAEIPVPAIQPIDELVDAYWESHPGLTRPQAERAVRKTRRSAQRV